MGPQAESGPWNHWFWPADMGLRQHSVVEGLDGWCCPCCSRDKPSSGPGQMDLNACLTWVGYSSLQPDKVAYSVLLSLQVFIFLALMCHLSYAGLAWKIVLGMEAITCRLVRTVILSQEEVEQKFLYIKK